MCVDNIPYIVPLNFEYQENVFYMHCAKEGRKLEMIKENPFVCFEMDQGSVKTADEACKFWLQK